MQKDKSHSIKLKALETLFNSIDAGIITLDRNYTVTSVNSYVLDWINLSEDELVGKSSIEIFHDKIGICPHCAAQKTFKTGESNEIMQTLGTNYAVLTAYPVKNETEELSECVVFIQDITERVSYQEEALSLYREVTQTKEYLESIIDNSADAIITTDLEGKVTSWNQAAEKIFGFSQTSAIGSFQPNIPLYLLDLENENLEKIKVGEVLKDIETLRKREDETLIEVSITLSPIKDVSGAVIGMSVIARDISGKKLAEKELIRKSQELARLFFISSAMRGTLELDKLLRTVLVAVTMSDGMGFNRAILLLVDEARNSLKGAMGVGPASHEEAWKVWEERANQHKTMEEIMHEVISRPLEKNSSLDGVTIDLEVPLDEDTILTRAVRQKSYFNVKDVSKEPLSDAILVRQLGTPAYAVVPLISRDKVIGIIWVDNNFNHKEITDEDMKFLASFSNHVAAAIENARLFEQVKMAEQQLENLFESMSDMVYFSDQNCVLKSINKAVCDKIGLPASEIIGRKCYEIFHGMTEPYKKCLHPKTLDTKKAYIGEIEDPHLGGTFLTSSSPMFDLNGEFIGSVHVARDISVLKNLQNKLVESQKMASVAEAIAETSAKSAEFQLIRHLAHSMNPKIGAVKSILKHVSSFVEAKGLGSASLQEEFYEGQNLESVALALEKAIKNMTQMHNQMTNIRNLITDDMLQKDFEEVDLNALFIEHILPQHRGSDKLFEIKYYSALKSRAHIHKVYFSEAINNLIRNAEMHGFKTDSDNLIVFNISEDENNIIIDYANNGEPLPRELTKEQFLSYGGKRQDSPGDGLGGAFIDRVIKAHRGTFDIIENNEFSVFFRITIPKESYHGQ